MGREEQIIQERLRKIDELRELGVNPYPSKFEVKNNAKDLQEKYAGLKPEEKTEDMVKIAGRVMTVRDLGKIAFCSVFDGTGKIQVTLQDKETPSGKFEFFKKYVDSGDFIGVEGKVFRTKRGELSILIEDLEILSKSILPLPEKFHGLKDDEDRLRKRYLDILLNSETREIFLRKSRFWQVVRNFLSDNGFLEVQTPLLETSAGGAAAEPFKTHHNALDIDVYLRISMGELWQKKLMVSGFPKTFEIGRQFRNEGMDADHLQDYMQMEFYWAYANYNDGMDLVKKLYRKIAKEVYGKTRFERHGLSFDLEDEWKVIDYASEIKNQTGLDIFEASREEIMEKLDELKEPYEKKVGKFRLVDVLWKVCRRKISGPAFLTGQPVEVSPLAKKNQSDKRKVEQFQVILGGSEVGNGYSELNDPLDQEERFIEQRKLKDSGDVDAMEHDKDFIEALKYGMPPTCGFGFSERLFSFLEGKPMRETVIFPLMKPLGLKDSKKGSVKK